MASIDRLSIPVEYNDKINLSAWYDQNLSNCALNTLTALAFTTELSKLFQIFTMRAEKKCFCTS